MYCIKEKRFADSVQYQIYEKHGKREVEDETLQHSYLFEKTNKSKKKLKENPFNDEKLEWMTEIEERDSEKESESLKSSRSRTIKKIYDIGRSNYWEWFLTLTFSPDKVDRYDYADCSKKLKEWLDSIRRRNPDMKYLVVPEQHKDGAWHFHGLFANLNDNEFKLSGVRTEKGQDIYNVGRYKLGFTEAIRLDGSFAVVSYLCKYITKQLCEQTKGKKRYWFSRTCDLPIVEEYVLNMKYEDIIEQLCLDDSRLVTKEGYVTVTYIDQSIPQTHPSL